MRQILDRHTEPLVVRLLGLSLSVRGLDDPAQREIRDTYPLGDTADIAASVTFEATGEKSQLKATISPIATIDSLFPTEFERANGVLTDSGRGLSFWLAGGALYAKGRTRTAIEVLLPPRCAPCVAGPGTPSRSPSWWCGRSRRIEASAHGELKYLVHADTLGEGSRRGQFTVGAVAILDPYQDVMELSDLRPLQTALSLLPHLYTGRDDPAARLLELSKVCEQARCVRLIAGSPNETAVRVVEWFTGEEA